MGRGTRRIGPVEAGLLVRRRRRSGLRLDRALEAFHGRKRQPGRHHRDGRSRRSERGRRGLREAADGVRNRPRRARVGDDVIVLEVENELFRSGARGRLCGSEGWRRGNRGRRLGGKAPLSGRVEGGSRPLPAGLERRNHRNRRGAPRPGSIPVNPGRRLQLGESHPVLRRVGHELHEDAEAGGGIPDASLTLVEIDQRRPPANHGRRVAGRLCDLDDALENVFPARIRLRKRREDRESLLRLSSPHRLIREDRRGLERKSRRAPGLLDLERESDHVGPGGLDRLGLREPFLGVRHVAVGERGLGRQEEQRDRARRGLERAAQRRPRVLRAAGGQEDRHERPQDLGVVRRHLERLLVDLDRLVDGPALAQEGRDDGVFLQGVDLAAGLGVEVRQLHVKLDVRRIRLDHLLVDPDRTDGVVVLRVVVRENLVLALRFGGQALLGVELGEPFVNVEARRIQAVDLLVDRDAAEKEPVAREVLGDLREIRNRLLVPVQSREEVADLVQDVDVARRLLEDLLVVLERGIDLSLRQGLLGRSYERVALARHDSVTPPSPRCDARRRGRTSAGVPGRDRGA